MLKVTDTKPSNASARDTKPSTQIARDLKPTRLNLRTADFIYLESRIITKGQPLPWGLNWAITYPATLTFLGVRS